METGQSSTSQTAIGFLGYREFDEGEAYRGAILVTDEWSKPMEFRCTAPVRPNHLQRTLYGSSLLPHVLTELIAAPLIASLRVKPELILIDEEAYFDVRHTAQLPIVRVTRIKSGQKHENRAKTKSLLLQCASGRFAQVEIEAHWKFHADLDSCGDRLRDLFSNWDLTEPFQRLAEGLQYVHDERVLES